MAKHRDPKRQPRPEPDGKSPLTPAPRLEPIEGSSFWDNMIEAGLGYLQGWWERHKTVVRALADDVH